MAAVPVTLVGIITTDSGSVNATFNGVASLSGLGVGGGPVLPPSDAHPEHPIYHPPGIWPDPDRPRPEHPIALPDPPTEPPTGPPDEDGFIKAPPPGGGWAYHNKYAWMYDPAEHQPQPKG